MACNRPKALILDALKAFKLTPALRGSRAHFSMTAGRLTPDLRTSSVEAPPGQFPRQVDPPRAQDPSIRHALSRSNFEPTNLTPRDYVDISSKPCVSLLSPSSSWLYYSLQKRRTPFPPNTKGFFYVHRPPNHAKEEEEREESLWHAATGQLRFRLVDSPDPQRFDEGEDLLNIDGLPWNLHLMALGKSLYRQRLYTLLTTQAERDKIDKYLERSKTLYPKKHRDLYNGSSTFLSNILDPFTMDFSRDHLSLFLLDPDCIAFLRLGHIFVVQPRVDLGHRGEGEKSYWMSVEHKSLYSGKAVCRFELVRVDLKSRVQPSLRLTIRVLEWVEPPKPLPPPPESDSAASIAEPPISQEEGELLRRWDWKTKTQRVWVKKSLGFLPPASVELLKNAYPVTETVVAKRLVPEFLD